MEREIAPAADRIMGVQLQILSSVGVKSSVPDGVFGVVGALANALEEDFQKYMDSFGPYLYNALHNREEPGLCAMAVGLVSDIVRALGEKSQPYCDSFMNFLLNNLNVSQFDRSNDLTDNLQDTKAANNQLKPAILQTFGDIAQAIGPHFETYLSVVAQVLRAAAALNIAESGNYEMLDYVTSLREGIMDAWSGAILAMKQGKGTSSKILSRSHTDNQKAPILTEYVPPIFEILQIVARDGVPSESLLRSAMGVIG